MTEKSGVLCQVGMNWSGGELLDKSEKEEGLCLIGVTERRWDVVSGKCDRERHEVGCCIR